MNYQAIYTEVVNLRFNSSTTKLAQVKNWVNQAEIALWNAADWTFKRMPVQTATPLISGGIARFDLNTLTNPAAKVHAVYNSLGDPLTYMRPDDWEAIYAVGTLPTGSPATEYTVMSDINPIGGAPRQRTLFVGPAGTGTLSIATRHRYYHINNAGALTAGVMSVDTDTPCWDSEFHYILVPWAIRLGKLLEDDPTASLDDQALLGINDMGMFNAMKDELAGSGQVEDVLQVWSC